MSGQIARQSFWASIVNYSGSLVGLFTTFYLFPLVFTKAENGIIGLFIEIGALLAGVAQLGTGYSIWKFFPRFKNDKGHNGAGFWLLLIPFIGFLLIAIILLLFQPQIMNYFGKNSVEFQPFYYWIIPFVFFFVFNNVFEVFSASIGNIIFASFLRENVVRLFLGLTGYLYYLHLYNFNLVIYFIPLIYGVTAGLNMLYILKNTHVSFKPDFDFVKSQPKLKSEFGQYTGYLFLTSVANLLVQRIDIVMISAMSTFDNTGVYRIALMMSVLIEIPTRSILQISNPKLADAIHHQDNAEVERLYKKTSLNQFILGCLALLCIWINIDLFFELMPNGSKYIDAKFALLFLGIGKLFTLLQGNSSAMLTFSKKYYLSLIVNFTAVFLGIYLNQIAIPKWGIEGAAIATSITWLISGIVVSALIWFIYKMNPFTWKIVHTTVIFGLFFCINHYFQNSFNVHHILFGGLKTIVIMGLAVWSIYRFNLSEDVKSMIQKLLRFSQK